MQALTSCKINYHPRGSGPPFGEQFKALQAAWHRIKDYNWLEEGDHWCGKTSRSPIRWVINGDCCLEMYLWCDTTRQTNHTVDVIFRDDVAKGVGDDEPALMLEADQFEVVIGPGVITSCDDLIKTWWKVAGQFNAHPWDANGIVTARRLGLTRQKDEPDFGLDEWDGYHATDEATFKAFDNGDFEREPQEAIWNRCNEIGMQWQS